MDDQRSFLLTTYDEQGGSLTEEVPLVDPLVKAQEELRDQGSPASQSLAHLGFTVTGQKTQPDNADAYLGVFFKADIPTEHDRRWHGFSPVLEVGRPWRRGVGVTRRFWDGTSRIYGVWFPWPPPRRPKVTKAARLDISPAELLSQIQ